MTKPEMIKNGRDKTELGTRRRSWHFCRQTTMDCGSSLWSSYAVPSFEPSSPTGCPASERASPSWRSESLQSFRHSDQSPDNRTGSSCIATSQRKKNGCTQTPCWEEDLRIYVRELTPLWILSQQKTDPIKLAYNKPECQQSWSQGQLLRRTRCFFPSGGRNRRQYTPHLSCCESSVCVHPLMQHRIEI